MKERRVRPIPIQVVVGYSAVLLVLVAAAQAVLAARGHTIDLLSTAALLPAAIWFLAFTHRRGPYLGMRPYGWLAVHVVTYVFVVGSYWLHAGWLVAVGDDGFLDAGWSGPLLGMTMLWGIALIAHGARTHHERGFDGAHLA